MHASTFGQVTEALQLAICALSAWIGDAAVRAAAATFAAAALLYGFSQDTGDWIDPQHRTLALDGAQFLVLMVVAIRWRRIWLIGAAAMQLLATVVDAVIIIDLLAGALAWLVVSYTFGWAVLACIGIGALTTRRRPARL